MNLAVIIALCTFILVCVICFYAIWSGEKKTRARSKPYKLTRGSANPLISPAVHREWEAQGTFNPTAVEDYHGTVHLFYRAIGADGISRISHAYSKDGHHIDGQSPYAVFQPLPGYGMPDAAMVPGPHYYDLVAHPSGGGWGGAEDPRATKIGDRVYMTYTAFEGWNNMRIGLTSIAVKDLEQGKWRWKRPMLISPAKARSKNWVIFPEKIHGKYAVLHSIAPRVMIAYLDSLDAVPPIKSSADHGGYGVHEKERKGFWDETMKGAGTPPLKTDKGWLVLYHAIHQNRYKVGAMLLDLKEPTTVLYRSPQPILAPDMPYENDGKPGVVYATGAVLKDDNLLVYYGGGDKHVCMAETPLKPLLEWLVRYGKV